MEVRGGVNFLSIFDSKRDGAEYRRNEHYCKSLSLVWIRIQEDLGNTFFFLTFKKCNIFVKICILEQALSILS